MPLTRPSLRSFPRRLVLAVFFAVMLFASASHGSAQVMAPPPTLPGLHYNLSLFQPAVPAAELDFLRAYAGKSTKELMHNKQFWKLAEDNFLPHCTFHYGYDRPLTEAFDDVVGGSKMPVTILQDRYLVIASDRTSRMLDGRAMLWIDLQDGIGVGAFYFHPTNGEPSPTINVFARQVSPGKDNLIEMSQLPPAFVLTMAQWISGSAIPLITPRYFLTGNKRKILLEHDEDYCIAPDGTTQPPATQCQQLNAEAADIDVTAAYYLKQVNYATNATAYFLNSFQVSWIAARDGACLAGPALYSCRVRMARARVRVIVNGR
ncbi:hypothetical protein [Silvibacterium sp.]|uniref:hypothetical protein n=1 Tax=Silvibacterium sp. TaxID=1964179 RepID=UPI0039E3A104